MCRVQSRSTSGRYPAEGEADPVGHPRRHALGFALPVSRDHHTGQIRRAGCAGGPCRVIGTSLRTTPTNAALMNGYLGYALDVESHHGPAVAHAAAAVLPAALAIGELAQASGRQLLEALVLGIEEDCRVSLAVGPNDLYARGFHPTSVAGSFGAAAAAGHLLHLDAAGAACAFGLAASQAGGLLAWADDHTEESRPFNPAMAARNRETASVGVSGIWRATVNLRCHVQIPRLPCLGTGWSGTFR